MAAVVGGEDGGVLSSSSSVTKISTDYSSPKTMAQISGGRFRHTPSISGCHPRKCQRRNVIVRGSGWICLNNLF